MVPNTNKHVKRRPYRSNRERRYVLTEAGRDYLERHPQAAVDTTPVSASKQYGHRYRLTPAGAAYGKDGAK